LRSDIKGDCLQVALNDVARITGVSCADKLC